LPTRRERLLAPVPELFEGASPSTLWVSSQLDPDLNQPPPPFSFIDPPPPHLKTPPNLVTTPSRYLSTSPRPPMDPQTNHGDRILQPPRGGGGPCVGLVTWMGGDWERSLLSSSPRVLRFRAPRMLSSDQIGSIKGSAAGTPLVGIFCLPESFTTLRSCRERRCPRLLQKGGPRETFRLKVTPPPNSEPRFSDGQERKSTPRTEWTTKLLGFFPGLFFVLFSQGLRVRIGSHLQCATGDSDSNHHMISALII